MSSDKPSVYPFKPVPAYPFKTDEHRQVLDLAGTLTSVSIAADSLVVIEDHHAGLWSDLQLTRHYDTTTARKHAQQILARCDRIDKLRAAVLAEQTARAQQ